MGTADAVGVAVVEVLLPPPPGADVDDAGPEAAGFTPQ